MTHATLLVLRKWLEVAEQWLEEGQRGDPNGAKAYQASLCVRQALLIVERAQAAPPMLVDPGPDDFDIPYMDDPE